MVPTPTRAPALNRLTLDPTATTSPAISCPVIWGYWTLPQSPLMVWMSEWHMPQYWIRMATSWRPKARRWNFQALWGPVGA